MLYSARGKGVVRERRDVTDFAMGQLFGGQRRDVKVQARG